MTLNSLPPGFDDPVDSMVGFHRRIERQLATLAALPRMLEAHGPDAASMTAAASLLDFFSRAMPVHHDDEDELARAIGFAAHARMDAEHREMDGAWRMLRRPLQAIAEGVRRTLPEDLVIYFRAEHASHLAFEESALHLAAACALDAAGRSALARGMAARRTRRYRFQ